jgi:hypothetical protein
MGISCLYTAQWEHFQVSAIGVDKQQILYFSGQRGPLLYTEVVL